MAHAPAQGKHLADGGCAAAGADEWAPGERRVHARVSAAAGGGARPLRKRPGVRHHDRHHCRLGE